MKAKVREYVVTGVTKPLKDGKTRNITLVAILVEQSDKEKIANVRSSVSKTKTVVTRTEELVNVYKAKFSIGMSVLNPADIDVANHLQGVKQAKRATKADKALVILNTSNRFFGDDTAKGILDIQLQRVIADPDKFIKVSPKK